MFYILNNYSLNIWNEISFQKTENWISFEKSEHIFPLNKSGRFSLFKSEIYFF